ncbi:DUF4282 domain-containing protein [Candidatus Poribacteria bacterium]|nr:DUF4282 domain-containing protein [Candidatus Poribacteria bacterium]MYH81507.1 DUF4282 domain-containing protein [Candidatus Poribacteria bacterium]MYK92629.1 DUF4282 domain-containing protein [Candidatus Poribacteria bacterium]
MKDFLKFKKMITPIIIPILFWVGAIICIIVGIVFITMGAMDNFGADGGEMVLMGFCYLFLGPIAIRVYCEFLIILFSVNDKLADIKDLLKHQQDNDNQSSSSDEG